MLDCVIPAHSKDFATLNYTVESIRRCCKEVRRIIVVSDSPWKPIEGVNVETFAEADSCWPFGLKDFEDCGCQPGWLFQQLLKLYALETIPDLAANILVCDSDVIWLEGQELSFLKSEAQGMPDDSDDHVAAKYCTFNSDTCPPIRSAVDLHRYDDFLPALLLGLTKVEPGRESAVCHHAVFQRSVIRALFERVEEQQGRPFWLAFREAARECQGRASEYELYNAFARRFFPERCIARPLAFAVVADFKSTLEKPPNVAFIVAHSHLRGLPLAELQDREGIINGNIQQENLRRVGQNHSDELAALLAGSGMF